MLFAPLDTVSSEALVSEGAFVAYVQYVATDIKIQVRISRFCKCESSGKRTMKKQRLFLLILPLVYANFSVVKDNWTR